MPVFQLRQVIYVECPACHWTKAVLADEHSLKRCFFCPHCRHVWITTETVREERARPKHRPEATELSKRHEVSTAIDWDLDPRVAKLIAHVRQTLALLNQEADERFLKHASPHEILKKKPFDES